MGLKLKSLAFISCVIACTLLNNALGQLSGKYTLGGSSSRNFTNWYTFADSLNRFGVSDTLILDVKRDFIDTLPLIFRKHKSFPTSKKAPVFIIGNHHSLQISRWYESLLLDSIDNIYFKSCIFINNSPNEPICIRIGPESDFIHIDSCNFQINGLTQIPFANYSSGYNGYYNGSASCYIAITHKIQSNLVYCFNKTNARAIRITYCKFETKNTNSPGPGRAILSRAWPMVEFGGTTNFYFANNTITNFSHAAIDLFHSVDDTIINNDISKLAASTSSPCVSEIIGIDIENGTSSNSGSFLKNNRIHDIPFKWSGTESATSGLYNFKGIIQTNQFNRNNNLFYSYCTENQIYNIRSNSYFFGFWGYLDFGELSYITITNISTVNFSGFQIDNSVNGRISHNKISQVYQNKQNAGYFRGFRVYGHNTIKKDSFRIVSNTIDSNYLHGDFSGFYQYNYSVPIDSVHVNYSSNSIRNNQFYTIASGNSFVGFFLSDTAEKNSYFTIVASNLIANNANAAKVIMVYDSTRTRDTSNFLLLQQNTFYHHEPKQNIPIYGYRSTVNGNHKLLGNIFDFESAGNIYPIAISKFQRFVKSSGNDFYLSGKSNSWLVASNNYSNIMDWKKSLFSDSTEQSITPGFVNPSVSNFQTSAVSLQNKIVTIKENPFDVYQRKRTAPFSDVGAIESNSFDLAMKSCSYTLLDSACPGVSVEIFAIVKNTFSDSQVINKISVSEGSQIASFIVNKQLKSGDSIKLKLSKFIKIQNSGNHIVKVYLDNFDDNPRNDTAVFSVSIKPPPKTFALQPTVKTGTFSNKPIYSQNSSLPDTTVVNVPVEYQWITDTLGLYLNSNYNVRWKFTIWALDNIDQPVSGFSNTIPTKSMGAVLKYLPTDTLLEGNTITIYIKVLDLITGCDTVFSKSVYIASVPRMKIYFQDTICVGDSLKIENNTWGGSGNYKYNWVIVNAQDQRVDSSSNRSPVFKLSKRGIYKLQYCLMDKKFGFSFCNRDSVWVGKKPTINFQVSKACSNQVTQISNQTLPKEAFIRWIYSDKSVTLDSISDDSLIFFKNGNPGKYTLLLKANDWGCWDSLSKLVSVNVTPSAKFYSDTAMCFGSDNKFINKTQWGGAVGNSTWYFGELGKVSRDTHPTYNYKSVGLKTVQLVAKTDIGCSDTFTQSLRILPTPVICDYTYVPDYSFAYYGMKFIPVDGSGMPGGNPSEDYYWTVNGKDTQVSTYPNYPISLDLKRDGTLGVRMTVFTRGTKCSCSIEKKVIMDRAAILENFKNTCRWIELPNGDILVTFTGVSDLESWKLGAVRNALGQLFQLPATSDKNLNTIIVSSSSLTSGVYYIQLLNNHLGSLTIPVVKN